MPSPRDITAKKTEFLPHEMYLLKGKTENKQIDISVKCYEEKEKP